MTRAWIILVALSLASLVAANAQWERGAAAALVVIVLSWVKLRLVLVSFIGVQGGWRLGLGAMFAILLVAILIPYALA